MAAVAAKDSAVTVTSVRKDPDGSYDVFGIKADARVKFGRRGCQRSVDGPRRLSRPGPWFMPPARAGAGIDQAVEQDAPLRANAVGLAVLPEWVAWKPMLTEALTAMAAL